MIQRHRLFSLGVLLVLLGLCSFPTPSHSQYGMDPPPLPIPPTVQFDSADYFVSEAAGTATITVTLSVVSQEKVQVNYATSDDTATAGADYLSASGTLTFSPGEMSKTFTVTILNDTLVEGSERVSLSLSNPTGGYGLGSPSVSNLTILDDDTSPVTVQFSATAFSVSETAAAATITVTLSGSSAQQVTVDYATSDGTAVAPDDYESTTGTLTFNLGETSKTFSVPIVNDPFVEGNETVGLTLSNAVNASLGSPSSATLTIVDNDTGGLTVTATADPASPNTVPVWTETTATLTATASNVPSAAGSPSWSWTYKVEYAETPNAWGPPPQGQYLVSIDPPPPDNPSITTLRGSFGKTGYWRIIDLVATVVYTDGTNTWTASGTANNVEVTVVAATISPDPIYVSKGGTALPTVTVTPPGAAPQVAFETTDPAIATAGGTAPYVTVVGVEVGVTQLQAKVGSFVLASVDVHVLSVTYSPSSGPAFTKVVFTMAPAADAFFSQNTTVTIDAVFSPTDFSEEFFSIKHSGAKVKFDPAAPTEIAIAVADVFPSEFLGSSNPAITMSLTGSVAGLVTLVDGDKQCTVEATFTITDSAAIGRLVDGVFEALDGLDVWKITSEDQFALLDPSTYLYAQIVRPANEFTQGAPSTMSAQIRAFQPDGTPVSPGVSLDLMLVSSTSSSFIYQSQKPFLMTNNAMFEGDRGAFFAITSDDGCHTQVVRLPP